jgi:hypothetical protein
VSALRQDFDQKLQRDKQMPLPATIGLGEVKNTHSLHQCTNTLSSKIIPGSISKHFLSNFAHSICKLDLFITFKKFVYNNKLVQLTKKD